MQFWNFVTHNLKINISGLELNTSKFKTFRIRGIIWEKWIKQPEKWKKKGAYSGFFNLDYKDAIDTMSMLIYRTINTRTDSQLCFNREDLPRLKEVAQDANQIMRIAVRCKTYFRICLDAVITEPLIPAGYLTNELPGMYNTMRSSFEVRWEKLRTEFLFLWLWNVIIYECGNIVIF